MYPCWGSARKRKGDHHDPLLCICCMSCLFIIMRGENVGLLLVTHWDVLSVQTQTHYKLQLGRNDQPDKKWSTSESTLGNELLGLVYEQTNKGGQVLDVDRVKRSCMWNTMCQSCERPVIVHLRRGALKSSKTYQQLFRPCTEDTKSHGPSGQGRYCRA